MAAHNWGRARINMKALDIVYVYFVFNTVALIVRCVDGFESHNQAFVQTENELRDMGEVVHLHVIPGQNLKDTSLHDGVDVSSVIQFQPPLLDFGEQAVGMPDMEQVTVHNPDLENSLHLLSISGSTQHFHCSFFQDKMVPPGGNTTFDVVFLARQVGNVENTLYIHTSQGSFRYQVFGVGIPNPYRIRPFIGAKVPLNTSFSPLIQLHNPHSSTLQVLEMYSSGGDLHLELPSGEVEASGNVWEIPPFETKPVMRASFVARVENNHTAFIRIKTNREKDNQILILPVEIEVTSDPGVYSQIELVEFGILRSQDPPKNLQLNLVNSGTKAAQITSVVVSPPNDAVSVEFRPVKLQPNSLHPTSVAVISFTASRASGPKMWSGNIVVETQNKETALVLPYQAQVLSGSLEHDADKTRFYVGKTPSKNVTQEVPITNRFNTTVAVHNVFLPTEASPYFSIANFTPPVILRPHEKVTLLQLHFHPNSNDNKHLHLDTQLSLHTNLSVFHIPITVFSGKLKLVHHRPESQRGQIDFGTMGVEEQRSLTFTIRNENPVDVVIREFGSNMDRTTVDLLGVEEGNGTLLTQKHNVTSIPVSPLVLKPHHFAMFKISLVAPQIEGSFAAEVIFNTQFEDLYIPMVLRTAEGSLNAVPENIIFNNAFPGKILKHEFKVSSSFNYYLEVKRITFQPNDTRFTYQQPKHTPVLLEPQQESIIGNILFNPRGACQDDCYIGLPTYIPVGQQWLLGMALDKAVADIDQYLYTRFKQKWELIGAQQQSTVNVTIQLDSSQLRGFLFPAQAHLHWPHLAMKRSLAFPLTQIGNLSITEFILENPADDPVLMQVLLLSQYPNPHTLLDLLSPQLSQDFTRFIITDPDEEVFSLQDLEIYHKSPNNPVPALRRGVESMFGVKPHSQSITMLVAGRTKLRCRLGFQPHDELHHSSLVIIRNNLTIIDMLAVRGQGGRGELVFGGQKPGSDTPLTFFLGLKHLKNCDMSGKKATESRWFDEDGLPVPRSELDMIISSEKKQSKSIPPSFTIRKSFMARNTGELPVYIQGYTINDSPCEGYGFKVLECDATLLQPNSSKRVDIAFTPDFSMSRIQRTLTIQTSLGPTLNFTLQATVPPHMLSKCSTALPRPSWEPILYYSVVCMMSFLLFSMIVASYFEADRILTADIIRRRSKMYSAQQTPYERGKVFDLRTVAGVKPPSETNGKEGKSPTQKSPPTYLISNGHTEPQNHTQVPPKQYKTRGPGYLLVAVFKYFFRLFSRTKSRDNGNVPVSQQKKPTRDIPDSTTKVLPTDKGNGNSKDETPSPNTPSTESIPFFQRLMSGRGRNITKRQHSNESSSDSNSDSKKHASKDTSTTAPPGAKDKRHKDNNARITTSLDNHASNTPITELDDITCDIPREGKRGNKKPKLDLKNFDRTKDKLRNACADYDDASSTTTDSSSMDIEDKMLNARDSTPEPPKQKKIKGKAKNDRKKNDDHTGEDPDDFILSTTSKAHKRIRVDSKGLGGNILRPSSLELPYTTKLEAEENGVRTEPVSPHSLAADIAHKAIKRNIKGNKPGKAKASSGVLSLGTLHATDPEVTEQSPDYLPSIWDNPKPASPLDGDLSELSTQTEQFAQKLNKTSLAPSNSPREPSEVLSSTSRSSSYSSMVSNGSGASDKKHANKSSSNGAAAQESTPNSFSLFGDSKTLGAIGTKPAEPVSPTSMPSPKLGNLWSMNSDTGLDPLRKDDLSSFRLSPMEEAPHQSQLLQDDLLNGLAQEELAAGLSEGIGPLGFTLGNQPRVAIMKELQAERRFRLLEYQQRMRQQQQESEWPGFGMQLPQESLWDTTAAPSSTWSTITHSPPRPKVSRLKQASNSLWNQPISHPSGQLSSGWESSIWGNAVPGSNDSSFLGSGPSSGNSSIDVPPATSVASGAHGETSPTPRTDFDPFNNNLATIWQPPGSTANNSLWGAPFKPKDDE